VDVMSTIAIRGRRIGKVATLDGRPGLRRELLSMDYVLPVVRAGSRRDVLELATRSPSAAGTLHFGRQSFSVDRVAYFGIFLERWYRADYHDAVVVDVGAHKGFYGAHALLEGAAEVHSYEPEAENAALLSRTAETFGRSWIVHRAAVGAASGTARLLVSAESAGHSIVTAQTEGARRTLRTETVDVVAMTDVLEDAFRPDSRLIVKIDAEGAECDIVLGTPVSAWRNVHLVFLEMHDFAPCSTSAILAHLAEAGLDVDQHELDDGAELIRLAR
jgi:FkbM family methyltransferase